MRKPKRLDFEGAELLLIRAWKDPEQELGIKLDPQEESQDTAEIFSDLRLRKSQETPKPLFQGQWQ